MHGVVSRAIRQVDARAIGGWLLEPLLDDRRVVAYLSFWARVVLRTRRPLIIGITGSVGKTTAVCLVGAVLSAPEANERLGSVHCTSQNMNDDIGVPLTILMHTGWLSGIRWRKLATLCSMPWRALKLAWWSRYPAILVIEYGTHWKGHLHRLVRLACPDIGVVTTIGPAHLDRLKTLEGVVLEKIAVVSAVPPTGVVILGDGHAYVHELERAARATVIKVDGRGIALSQQIARAVGRHLGVADEAITRALSGFQPVKGRLHRFQAGTLTVIDDSYNANPMSMKLGLDTLADLARPGQRRVAVLSSMRALGDDAGRYHIEIGAYARERSDVVIGVGELARYYRADHWFATSAECAEQIEHLLRPNDCVLVKGSAPKRTRIVVARLSRGARVPSHVPG